MITLFACPKAFSGHIEVIQRNAIRSWIRLDPRPEIILLGDEPGVASVCQEFGLVHWPDLAVNDFGTPLVSSVFAVGQAMAHGPVVAYINCDIMLLSDFLPVVRAVANRMAQFLLVGQRCDVDIMRPWDFAPPDWETDLRDLAQRIGRLHSAAAMDYFVFPAGMYHDLPPFAIGRTRWDNWLLWRARSTGIPVVDASAAVTVLHQNHSWPQGKVTPVAEPQRQAQPAQQGVGVHEGKLVRFSPEVQRNQALAPGEQGVMDIWAANWMITRRGRLRRRPWQLTPAYVKFQLKWVAPMKRPWIGRAYRRLASVWHELEGHAARLHQPPRRPAAGHHETP